MALGFFQCISKFKSFREAIELSSMKVGFFLFHVSNISFYCYHLPRSLWLLVEHFKHLHRVSNFLKHFGDICGPFFWALWGVWTRMLYGLQFLQRQRRMHSGIFQICRCSFTSSKCFLVFWLVLVDMCIAKQRSLCVSLHAYHSTCVFIGLFDCFTWFLPFYLLQ